jgi:hypothetical protein
MYVYRPILVALLIHSHLFFSPHNSSFRLHKPTDGRLEISSDSDSDEDERERRRLWERQSLRGNEQLSMARGWIEKARKRLRFDSVTRGIQENALQSSCLSCGRGQANLHSRLASKGGLDRMIKAFEAEHFGADGDNLNLWKAFYRRNASFYTVCSDCSAFKSVTEELERRTTRGVDISSSDDSDDDGPKFAGSIPLPGVSSEVMAQWLSKARTRLEDEGKVAPLGISAPSPPFETATPEVQVNEVGRALLSKWLDNARESERKKAEDRGEEIRNEITDILGRMSPSEDWFLGSLRGEGKSLDEMGKNLDVETKMLKSQRNTDVQSIRSTLTKIETECEEELQSIDAEEKQEVDHARSQHDQALAQRHLELTRAGIEEEGQTEQMACEKGRAEPALLQKKAAIAERHQNQRELVKQKAATAKANGEAVMAGIQSRFHKATSAPEKDFRQQAMRWIERSKRRLQVLESERRK